MAKQFCTNCGNAFEGAFCTRCGTRAAVTPPVGGGQVGRGIKTGVEPIDSFLAGRSAKQIVGMVAIALDIILTLILMLVDYFVWKGPGHISGNLTRYLLYQQANFYIWLPFMLLQLGALGYSLWLMYNGKYSSVFMIMLGMLGVLVVIWITDGILLAIQSSSINIPNAFFASLWMGCAVYVHAGLWSAIFKIIALVLAKTSMK